MGRQQRKTRGGRTVRLRFTLLYAGLFLVSAIALLALTNLFSGWRVTEVAPVPGQPAADPDLASALDRVHALEEQLSAQSRQLLVGSVLALLVMVAVSVVLGRTAAGRVLRPLRTITATTRRITAANLHERLDLPGPTDEVTDLADTIDDLLERLEASFAAQRRFVANASHELRTPLATMRATVDVATAKPKPPPAQTIALADRVRTELDRVDGLLDGLLVLARAQHGPLADRVEVSLSALVSDGLAARARDLAAKELTVDAEVTEPARTHGSLALLSRLTANLVDNAITHNQFGGWIKIVTGTAEGVATLVVETGGPVLDPDHVALLGQPFQRLTADRTGSETGSGLGLSIVAAIVDAHAGRLELSARPEGGLRVVVSLPAGQA